MVAFVVMAYVLIIQQGLENKVEKNNSYRNKPLGFESSNLRFGL